MSILPNTTLTDIKNKIELETCPIHGGHPVVTITGERFSVDCCCESFREDLTGKVTKEVKNAMRDETVKALKGQYR